VRLRPAAPEDASALAGILGDWVRETGWMPVLHSREEDLGFLGHLIATTDVTLAEDGPPLGFLALDGEEVRALYLAPAARGRGIGRALLDRAKAARPRLSLWVFEANPRAVAFYGREGFRVAERTSGAGNEEGLPDLRMVWEAPP
jgi:GNAT superfamily N-acetyltransferase